MGKPRPKAPSDAQAAQAWDEIMRIAARHCLIAQSYGGVAVLAMPEDQRESGIRGRCLKAAGMEECDGD